MKTAEELLEYICNPNLEDIGLITENDNISENNFFEDEYGGRYTLDGKCLIGFAEGKDAFDTYFVKDGTETICESSLYKARVNKIVIPQSVTCIEQGAFNGCKFSEITIPSSVIKIGKGTFLACGNLKKVTINTQIKELPAGMFVRCKNLEQIVIPEGVTSIDYDTFLECVKLRRITLPSTLEQISQKAFVYCTGLEEIICRASLPPYVFDKPYEDNQLDKRSIQLFVPQDRLASYRDSKYWQHFRIYPI